MTINSYAKINLCLKVFKKENNESKHQIDSIFYLYKGLYDVINIQPSNALSITYLVNNQPIIIPDCLVTKTLNYLKEKYGWDINYKIIIDKHIPIGSGLGGASSNAAVVINYLLTQNEPTALHLKDIALNLGSDIPFFLTRYEVARVKRYGEYVTPLANINTQFELIDTKIQCSTNTVFRLLDEDSSYTSQVELDQVFNILINKQHINVVYNDLTKYIIKSNIQLQEWLNKYPESWFSGSGGTLVRIKEK